MNGLGTPFLPSVPAVLLIVVCGVGYTVTDWDFDGILLPETESAAADLGCDCFPRTIVSLRWAGPGRECEVLHRGQRVTTDELRRSLARYAERGRHEDGWCSTRLLIRADRRLPWSAVRSILDLCLEPEVGIRCLQFATFKPGSDR